MNGLPTRFRTFHARGAFPHRARADVLATVPSEFDRTHVASVALAFDLGRRWRAGSRFVFYTGNPTRTSRATCRCRRTMPFAIRHFFASTCVSKKRWAVGKNGTIAFVVEGQNVTLSKETSSAAELDCTGNMPADRTSTTNCSRTGGAHHDSERGRRRASEKRMKG